MTKKERYDHFVGWFTVNMPDPETELKFKNSFELLVAVVLSAQCTDKRVNIVTEKLFLDFPSAALMATSNFDELFPYIRSISYPNNKTKHLLGLSKILTDKFNGNVPMSIDQLQTLPGVGRKTANVIVSVLDQQPAMAVDTHVFRVSKRLGLVTQIAKTPLEVEKQLIKNIPSAYVHKAHHWLILHGRYTCLARSPKCEECKITHFCRYFDRLKSI